MLQNMHLTHYFCTQNSFLIQIWVVIRRFINAAISKLDTHAPMMARPYRNV